MAQLAEILALHSTRAPTLPRTISRSGDYKPIGKVGAGRGGKFMSV